MHTIWDRYFNGDYTGVLNSAIEHLSKTNSADFLHISGLSLVGQNRISEAKNLLWAASTLSSTRAEWFSNASVTLLSADPTASLEFAEEGLKHHPLNADLHFHHANALAAFLKYDDAIDAFNRSITINNSMDSVLNKGNCYKKMGEPREALSCYDTILEIDPEHQPAMLGKAVSMVDIGQINEAAPYLEKIKDYMPEAGFLYGIVQLSEGNYIEGWKYYRERFNCGFSKKEKDLFKKPILSDLKDAAGKTVLFVHEQGYGDALQFVRFLPYLKKHAGNVIVVAPKPLNRLFQVFDPIVEVKDNRPPEDTYDFEVPMMDMPYLLGTTLDSIPNDPYFLTNITQQKKNKRFRVGLCWAGSNMIPTINTRRSIKLETLNPLAEIDVDFVSLQLQDKADSFGAHPHQRRLETAIGADYDYLNTALVMKGLDLVITVDTSVAHLAGGMGIPTWIMSRHDACWRWLKNRDDSPWYPTVKLFTQPPPLLGQDFSTDWDTVVQQIKTELQKKVQ
jgi:tetratricopeptide (TPR) repeat protein